jgi:hypothetical protein
MPLLGEGALAMWWDMAAAARAEFEDWHSHEHFAERLALPGFLRATRWTDADGGEGIFQLYEIERHDVVASEAYLKSLNAPSPWSTAMMPHHRNIVRSQCHRLESHGSAVARHAAVWRLSPAAGRDDALHTALKPLIEALPGRPGITGAHLLRHETPTIATTTEQKIRGDDRTADWLLIVCGYDAAALRALAQAEGALGPSALRAAGASTSELTGLYALSLSALPGDLPPRPATHSPQSP